MQTLGLIARELTALSLDSRADVARAGKLLIEKAKIVFDREAGSPNAICSQLDQIASNEPFTTAHAVQAANVIQTAARDIVRNMGQARRDGAE